MLKGILYVKMRSSILFNMLVLPIIIFSLYILRDNITVFEQTPSKRL